MKGFASHFVFRSSKKAFLVQIPKTNDGALWLLVVTATGGRGADGSGAEAGP